MRNVFLLLAITLTLLIGFAATTVNAQGSGLAGTVDNETTGVAADPIDQKEEEAALSEELMKRLPPNSQLIQGTYLGDGKISIRVNNESNTVIAVGKLSLAEVGDSQINYEGRRTELNAWASAHEGLLSKLETGSSYADEATKDLIKTMANNINSRYISLDQKAFDLGMKGQDAKTVQLAIGYLIDASDKMHGISLRYQALVGNLKPVQMIPPRQSLTPQAPAAPTPQEQAPQAPPEAPATPQPTPEVPTPPQPPPVPEEPHHPQPEAPAPRWNPNTGQWDFPPAPTPQQQPQVVVPEAPPGFMYDPNLGIYVPIEPEDNEGGREDENGENKIFGLSPLEIGLLAFFVIVIGIAAIRYFRGRKSENGNNDLNEVG